LGKKEKEWKIGRDKKRESEKEGKEWRKWGRQRGNGRDEKQSPME